MDAGKLPVHLRFWFKAMHVRDAFIKLPYRNFIPVRRYGDRQKTAFSGSRMHGYPGLTADCTPVAPNRLRVSDSAYIEADGSHGSLSLITDACSHKVTGWNLSPTLHPSGVPVALKTVLSSLNGKYPGLIRHSGRGSQHDCRDYISHPKDGNIQISMTEDENPRENAMAERISGILKSERIHGCKPDSWQETPVFVNRIIDLHNSQRPYQISYITPVPVHQTGWKTEHRRENYYRSGSIPAG
jgi:transposase InsO family protein